MTARLPFLLLAWLFLLTGPGYAQKNPYAMTFEVDLSNAIAKGFFNPASDNIDVAGNFNAWGNPANVLNPVGETGIYTFTTGQDFAPGYTFEFKFRINGDWANSQPGSNAEYTISEGVNLFSYTWQTPAIGWANLQWPQFIELERGEPLPDATLFGKIWIPDVTSNPEPVTGLQVWLGVNPENTDPATWDLPNQWFESSSYMQTGNDHEYSITLSGEMLPHFLPGTHYYVFRYRYGNDDYVYGAWGGPWDGVNNTSGVLTLNGEEEPDDKILIHYWHFNTLSGTVESVVSDYSVTGTGVITYPGTGPGFMDERTHRPQDPVSNLNLHMDQQPNQGAVLRVRNPANTRELIFEAPSAGFENLSFTFATVRTGNGAQQQEFYYSVNGGTDWVLFDGPYDIPNLDIVDDWILKNFDLSTIDEVNNNNDLRFRIRFVGENSDAASGNNRFDNITLKGDPITLEPELFSMTIQLDLTEAIEKNLFDPVQDFVDVAGSFNDWGNPANLLNPVDESGIYTFTTGQVFAPGNTLEFKFRINGDWSNSQPGSNAEYTISEGVNLFSYSWQTPGIGWANLQWPSSIEIIRGYAGSAHTAFAQVYIPGVTDLELMGPNPALQAWFGINGQNNDPADWNEENQWIIATFNEKTGSNHEYKIEFNGTMFDELTPGDYYYAPRFQFGNDPQFFGGYNADGGNFWDGVNYVSGQLTIRDFVSASLDPDTFIFGDFSDFDETGAFTTITWNDADFVQGVFILIEDEMVHFDFEVTEIDGATSTLHITLPEDDKKLQFPKNGDFTVSGVVEFNHGDNATFTITFTDPTWWVAIRVVDQGDQSNIANAEILIQETNQSYFTDNDGWADFTLPAGNYTLTITAEGYVAVENISLTVLGEFAENTLTVEMSPAQFTYQLLLEVSPELAGQVEGAGEYQEGEQVVLTATPAWGYYFVHWTLADQTVVSTNASFSYTMPAEDVTLIAHFSTFPAISEFPWLESFEAESFPPFGWQRMAMPGTIREWVSVTTQNNTPGGARSARHTYAPTSAGMQDGWLVTPPIEVPETGTSALSFWSKNAYTSYYHKNSVLISTGSSNPLSEDFTEVWSPGSVVNAWRETVINLDAYAGETIHIAFRYQGINAHEWYLDDVGITFIPDPDTYTLSLVAQPAEGGTVEGDGDYEEGYQAMVTATVAQGYEFVSWTDSEGTPLSTEASFLFTMPAEDVTLTANFLALPAPTFALTLEALPAAGGSLAGAGEYEEGEAVTLTATPNQGYAFVKWTDSEDNDISTAASFEFIMPGADITLIALFDFADATDHLTLSGLELYPNPSRGSFNIRSQALVLEIQMTDLTGKVIATSNVQDYEVDFSLQLDPGIYLIRVRTSEGVSVRKLQIQ